MLDIITGAAASGRDRTFLDMVEKAVDGDKRVLVIVPDQYSFECDKKLYDRLGAKRFNSIETKGFNRLAKEITERYAGSDSESANEQLKLIVMYKAITRLKAENSVKFYKRALDKGSFIGEALKLIRDFSRSGITPEDLHVASERSFGSLSRKLYDLSELYSFYIEELGAAGLKDDRTNMEEAVKYAAENGSFAGMTLFIDAFTDFSYDEYKLLECMIGQAEDTVVSLALTDGGSGALYYPFAVTVRTRQRLRSIASEHNVKINETACKEISGAANSLLLLNKALCGGAIPDNAKCSDGSIKLITSNDVYDEAEYICSEIMRLTRRENYSLNDIAVVSRTLENSAPVLEGTFERYGIPYFSDLSSKADESVIAIYIKSIFECVISESYRTPAILRYIKSPLCKLYDYDISDIEDYCYTWSVKGDMWKQEFVSHDEKNPVPARLEETRKQIIEPLERFKSACEDADCAKICKALFALLDEIDVSAQVYSVIKRGAGDASRTETELAREYKQLWSGIIGAVVTINESIGQEKMSLKQFYELFKLMISQMKLSQPPQKVQCIRCGRAESSRLDNVRVLFVMDANDGIFPADVRSEGLFTEREKQQLEALDIELESSASTFADKEKLVLYSNLVLPTDRLYMISTLVGSDGRKASPSKVIGYIEEFLSEIEHINVSELPLDFFCTSYRSAYYKYLEHSKEKLAVMHDPDDADPDKEEFNNEKKAAADAVASLEAALSANEEYRQKISAVKNIKDHAEHKLSPKIAKELFVRDKLHLSATRIDNFYNCPFMYYCKNGLKLHPPKKIDLGKSFKGNYLHRCLERIMSTVKDGEKVYNDAFLSYTEEQLKEKIHSEFLAYREEENGGDYGKNAAYFAELDHYEDEVLENILLIQREFSDCLFIPQFFEYKLDKKGGESILELKISDDVTVSINGSVDRADVFTDEDGKRYLRIVDYKTGSTKFELKKLYHGLNLQMLIYMLAMTEGLNDLLPAAVMYSHIQTAAAKLAPDDDRDDEAILLEKAKKYKPDGMVLKNKSVLEAFNTSLSMSFAPYNKNQKDTVTEKIFEAAEIFVKKKIIDCAEKLIAGKIEAAPVFVYNGSRAAIKPCTYCDYYGICGRDSVTGAETVMASDKELFMGELEKIAENKAKEDVADE